MKVLIQISIAGHVDDRRDFYFLPGQEADVDEALAGAWIASGVATAILDDAIFDLAPNIGLLAATGSAKNGARKKAGK